MGANVCSMLCHHRMFFFFNDTATTEIYTLSLHDALPICRVQRRTGGARSGWASASWPPRPTRWEASQAAAAAASADRDRKSTRLNSSHANISYAVFCLKKKKPYSMHPIGPHQHPPLCALV